MVAGSETSSLELARTPERKDGADVQDCIFCKIANGEIPCARGIGSDTASHYQQRHLRIHRPAR